MTLYEGEARSQATLSEDPDSFYYFIVHCTTGTKARFDRPFDNMNESSNSSVTAEIHTSKYGVTTLTCNQSFTKVVGYYS